MREGVVFQSTKTKNTIASYDDYLQEYPAGTFVSEAQKLREDIRYNTAKQKNTVFYYDTYLKEYPNGKYLPEIKNLREIKVNEEKLKTEANLKIVADYFDMTTTEISIKYDMINPGDKVNYGSQKGAFSKILFSPTTTKASILWQGQLYKENLMQFNQYSETIELEGNKSHSISTPEWQYMNSITLVITNLGAGILLIEK